jgi:hypothetical protein
MKISRPAWFHQFHRTLVYVEACDEGLYQFRSKHSCETQLVTTIQKIAQNLISKGQVDVILLDFAKAFDKVPHRRLLHKLKFYGIDGTTLAWICCTGQSDS